MACTLLSLIAIFSLFISPALCSTNALFSSLGGRLNEGQSLVLHDYRLTMQGDCQLVFYQGKTVLWSSGTWLQARDCYLILEPNGELKIVGIRLIIPSTIWSSRTKSARAHHALAIKYDGTIHIYGPTLWSALPSTATTVSNSLSMTDTFATGSTMWAKDTKHIGDILVNNGYKLELSQTCDLILKNTINNAILWHTGSIAYTGNCYFTMAANGELQVYNLGGTKLWGNGVMSDYSDYVLALQPNGELVVYGPSIWVRGKPSVKGNGEKIAMVTNE